jgi:hypothetical protein
MHLLNNPDVTYSQARAAIWSSVEINVGIVCNTVIVLRPFLSQYFPRLFPSYVHSNQDQFTPNKPRSGGGFPKFLDPTKTHELSYIEATGKKGSQSTHRQDESDAIVVVNTYNIASSKGADTESMEDMIARSKDYSPA